MNGSNDEANLSSKYGSIAEEDPAVLSDDDELDDPLMPHFQFEGLGLKRLSSVGEAMSNVVHMLDPSFPPLPGDDCSVRSVNGHASIISEIPNIMKNLIGCGVLSLSGGIAEHADSTMALFSGTLWIVVLGAMFAYFCLLIAKVCQLTGANTYREMWEETLGSKGAVAVALCNAMKPALADLAYSTILSQTFQSLLQGVGIDVTRRSALLLVTIFGVLPLCLLKNLRVLAPFSVLGTFGIVLSAIAMVTRCIDGSYGPGGKYENDIPQNLRPSFGNEHRPLSTQALPFVCMIFESWIMHYNAPRFYTELRDATIPRFSIAVSWSFGLSGIIFVVIALAGFLTFGGNSDSYILNNYSPRDPLATMCRFAIAVSTLVTYPIVFIGFRDGVIDLVHLPQAKQTSTSLNVITVILLSLITAVAMFVTDLGLINAFGGGTLATAITFVFPAFMYRVAVEDQSTSKYYSARKREVVVVFALMVIGVVLGLIGVWVSVSNERDKK